MDYNDPNLFRYVVITPELLHRLNEANDRGFKILMSIANTVNNETLVFISNNADTGYIASTLGHFMRDGEELDILHGEKPFVWDIPALENTILGDYSCDDPTPTYNINPEKEQHVN